LQRELPAVDTGLFGGFAGGVLGVGGQAGELGFVGDDFGEGVGGVEQVFGELGGQLRQFFHDGLEARLLVFRQFGAERRKSRISLSTIFFCSADSVAYSGWP
jgi:hypothetical protein